MITDSEEVYDKVRELLSPSMGVPLPKNELTEKLLTNIFTEKEAFIVANGIKKALRPTTVRKIRKRTGIPRKELKEILEEMNYRGKIIKKSFFCVMPPYLPGLFEVYFTHNRDDPERMKKAGEAHYALIESGFHVEHSARGYPLFRVLPAADPTLKSLEVDTELDVAHQILPYEVLSKYLKKQKTFAVQPCSCRIAAKLSGNPCKRTDENFCISTGLLAKQLIKSEVAREVSYEELMEVMRKAEKQGLVHETTNMQKTSMFMCNCCSCCCGFLKQVKELKNKRAIAKSNFNPVIQEEKCTLCETCVDICPMEAIGHIHEEAQNHIVITLEDCIGCGVCASNCPEGAIRLEKVREVEPVKGDLGVLKELRKSSKASE